MTESSELSGESFDVTSDSARQRRKRQFSAVPKSYLNELVSSWNRQLVEKYLHIFVEDRAGNGQLVLQKGNMHTRLTDNQNKYFWEVANYLGKLPKNLSLTRFIAKKDQVLLQLNKIKEQILESKCASCNTSCPDHVKIDFVKYVVGDFIDNLKHLCLKAQGRSGISESVYSDFARCFARMCLLKPRCADEVVWEDLAGVTRVVSEADLIFCKQGLEQVDSQTSFSVIEVKKQAEDLCSPSKKARKSYSGCADQSSSMYERIMGRHAGELLLNLFSFLKEGKKVLNCLEYSIPGMIFDGYKVAITTLVIKKTHFDKLIKKEHLDDDDKAVMYISYFYRIFDEELRNELMEILIGLNNIPDFLLT